MKVEQITFLIHPFCYSWAEQGPAWAQPYVARESACAEGWWARLQAFPRDAVLVILPGGCTDRAADFYAAALSALGDRCVLLDAPDCHAPEFWSAGDPDGALLKHVRDALVHQRMGWNKEELYDALHTHACCRQLCATFAERELAFDRSTVTAEAWGESFDGCVTKYSLNLRRMLELSKVVRIAFELTVPDALFLLDASLCDDLLPEDGLRLFVFEHAGRFFGLYTSTEHALSSPPAHVVLPTEPETVVVKSKQGIRLWPEPDDYILRDVPEGYLEPSQTVVTAVARGLRIPVSAGLAYRLAKAPAYVFMPQGMVHADARRILASARIDRGAS
jgi:hypothetical protein